MPAMPKPTAKMLEIASWAPDASTSGGATGRRKSEIGVQTPANWMKPPTAARAASTVTGHPIELRGIASAGRWGGYSRTYAEGSPPKTRKIIRNV